VTTYLFEYRYEGHIYGLEIPAQSLEEARGRISQIPFATYQGEVIATAPYSAGWFVKVVVWLRNALGR
jgi:hypothetical protein